MVSYDIMEIDRKYEKILEWLDRIPISKEARESILEYEKERGLRSLTKTRRLRILGTLGIIARDHCSGDFTNLSERDIRDTVSSMDNNPAWNVRTRLSYRGMFKQYCRWLEWGNEGIGKKTFPKSCAWIRGHVRRREQNVVSPDEVLTEDEIVRLIRAGLRPIEQAWAAVLYETGARVSELGNRKVGDVQVKDGEWFLNIRPGRGSKTGARSVLLVASAPFLREWIERHPWERDPESPLWPVINGKRRGLPQKHASLTKIIKTLAKRAGIQKRVYSHLLRHSRATHLLANNWMSRSEVELLLGWVPGTDVVRTYVHLTQKTAFAASRRMYGMAEQESRPDPTAPKICPNLTCKTVNKFTALICRKCRTTLVNRDSGGNRVSLSKAFENRIQNDTELKFHVDQLLHLLNDERIET